MPRLARLGVVVLVLGLALDVAVHGAVSAGVEIGLAHQAGEPAAHLATFVGMVLIFVGVVIDGVRQSRARRSAGRSKGVA